MWKFAGGVRSGAVSDLQSWHDLRTIHAVFGCQGLSGIPVGHHSQPHYHHKYGEILTFAVDFELYDCDFAFRVGWVT